MASFNAGAIEATLELDRSPFSRGIELARQQGRRFAAERFEATLSLNSAAAAAEIARLNALLDRATRDRDVRIDLDDAAMRIRLAELEAELDRVTRNRDTRIDVDTSGARGALGALGSSVGGVSASLGGMLPLALAVGPALIPGIAGATAALGGFVAMLSAAGGGLGILGASLIGNITRVSKAQKDLTAAQDAGTAAAAANAAAQQRVRTALQGVGDAERAVAAARRNAAASVAAAEQQLGAAQDTTRRAQEALNQARADAVQRLEDMRDQLRHAALDEEGSELAVREAKLRLDAVMADPAATMLSQQQAQLAYDRALEQMNDARRQHDDLATSVAAAQKAGVKGDAQVVAAKDRLTAAQQAEKAAATAVAKAQADGARSVADARRSLARAEEQVAQARTAAAVASSALAKATRDQAAAMAKLDGPAATFTAAMTRAGKAWNAFLDATDDEALGIATQFLNIFTKNLPKLTPVVKAVTPVISDLLDQLDRWLDNGGMKAITDFLEKYGPDAIEGFAHVIGNLAITFGHLAKAFAPIGMDILHWFEDLTGKWADSTKDLEKKPGFQKFIDYVRKYGPKFVGFLKAAGGALLNIGTALAPSAGPVLDALTWGLQKIADMDPTQLALVAGGIETVAGAVLLFTSDGLNPAGWILLFAGINTGISGLGAASDDANPRMVALRDTVKDLQGWLGDKWHTMWTRTLKPDLEEIRKTIEDDFLPAWDAFWPVIQPIVKFLGEVLAVQVELGLGNALTALNAGLELMAGAMNVWTGAMTGDWDRMWLGMRQETKGGSSLIERAARVGLLGPMGLIVASTVDRIRENWNGIKKAFADPINWVIDHVLNPFINGLNLVANKLGKGNIFKPLGHVSYYQGSVDAAGGGGRAAQNNNEKRLKSGVGMATGGVLPGYTPGRDVHHYASPTAPDLHLSGGEAVMVPEWTRLHGGAAGVAAENAAARRGQRLASGGVVNPDARVYVDGEPMSKIAASQLLLAEKLSGMNMRVMQGSWQPTTSYSGTSHNGPGVMDTAPGNFLAQSWLRKVGFAAWGRNFAGAHQAGSGAHVHSVSRLDPGARGQSQLGAYAAGGDGLGGSDYGPRPPMLPGLLSMLSQFGDLAVAGGGGGGGFSVNPVKMVANLIGKVRNAAAHAPGGAFGKTLGGGAVSTLAGLARGWAAQQAKSLLRFTPLGAAGSVAGAAIAGGKKLLHSFTGKDPKGIAGSMLGNYGWSGAQMSPLDMLWTRESGWNVHADNPTSSAYGIPQALPGSKMATAGADWRDNPATQIRWGLGYIKGRYGSPAGAWAHSQRFGWYDQGGVVMPGVTNVLNESGKPEALLNAEQWQLAKRAFGVDRPAGSLDSWTREDIERLIDAVREANPVTIPAGGDAQEQWDRLGFELRAQGRGGKR